MRARLIYLADAGAHLAAGVEQRSRSVADKSGNGNPLRGIPRHRRHAAAGHAALERSVGGVGLNSGSRRRCRPAATICRRWILIRVPASQRATRSRERLTCTRSGRTELAARSLRADHLVSWGGDATAGGWRRGPVIGSCCSPGAGTVVDIGTGAATHPFDHHPQHARRRRQRLAGRRQVASGIGNRLARVGCAFVLHWV
jgi:hypothetical protein